MRIILILAIHFCRRCRHRAVISGLFLARATGEYRGICCLSRLWYDCVGGDVGKHKISSVYDSYTLVVKPLKGLFMQINKLGKLSGQQMLSAERARIIAIHSQAAKRNSQRDTGNYSKRKKKPCFQSCIQKKMHRNSCKLQTVLNSDSHTSLLNF